MPTISQILQILAIAYVTFVLALILIALAIYNGLREIANAIRNSLDPTPASPTDALRQSDFMVQLNDARPRRKK